MSWSTASQRPALLLLVCETRPSRAAGHSRGLRQRAQTRAAGSTRPSDVPPVDAGVAVVSSSAELALGAIGFRTGGPFHDGFRTGDAEAGSSRSGYHETRSARAAVVAVRLVPVVPYTAINYAAGLVPLGLGAYLLGTAIGMVPGTIAYAALGAFGTSPERLFVGLAVLVALTVLAALVGRRMLRGGAPRGRSAG